MSHKLENGMVTLRMNESLQIFEEKQTNLQHQMSVIKSTQESYDKKLSFQVGELFIEVY